MSDYAFVHEGRAFTSNQTEVAVSDVAAHNAAIESAELAAWQAKPLQMMAYYSFPAEHNQQHRRYCRTFCPLLTGATVTTWQGKVIGQIVDAHVYLHNFGSRMVSMRINGTNGASYYGRASYDWGQCIQLRRAKV